MKTAWSVLFNLFEGLTFQEFHFRITINIDFTEYTIKQKYIKPDSLSCHCVSMPMAIDCLDFDILPTRHLKSPFFVTEKGSQMK